MVPIALDYFLYPLGCQVMLDGQPLYITEINHDLDPSNNTWWMTISGEWIKSFDENLMFPPVSEVDVAENPGI